MGRGKGKGKKLTPNHKDPGSGEEEKIPAQKRRGRPQKQLKDETNEEGTEKLLEEEYDEDTACIKVTNGATVAVNRKKRGRSSQTKEAGSAVGEEEGTGAKLNVDDSAKSNGFRHIGSRRKSKPRRAAEVGVECS